VAKVSFGGKEAAKVNKIVKRKLEAVEMGRRGAILFIKAKFSDRREGGVARIATRCRSVG
jgi:hypothetical protein